MRVALAEATCVRFFFGEDCGFDESRGQIGLLERIIDGEHYVLRAHGIETAAQRVIRAHAGGGNGNVSPDVEGRRIGKRAAASIADQPAAVETPQAESQGLAAVP